MSTFFVSESLAQPAESDLQGPESPGPRATGGSEATATLGPAPRGVPAPSTSWRSARVLMARDLQEPAGWKTILAKFEMRSEVPNPPPAPAAHADAPPDAPPVAPRGRTRRSMSLQFALAPFDPTLGRLSSVAAPTPPWPSESSLRGVGATVPFHASLHPVAGRAPGVHVPSDSARLEEGMPGLEEPGASPPTGRRTSLNLPVSRSAKPLEDAVVGATGVSG